MDPVEQIAWLEARLTETRDAGQRLVNQIERLEARVAALTAALREVRASHNHSGLGCDQCQYIRAALDAAASGA